MLSILNESELRSQHDIEQQFPNCKYVWLIRNLEDTVGRLYAVSDDLSSSHDIYIEAEKMRNNGENCVVCGNYSEGNMAGVQYLLES